MPDPPPATALDRSEWFRRGWVYCSDPSWHPQGNRSGRRYHWPRDDDPARAVCSSFTALDETMCHPAGDAPLELRCRRPGCRQRWAAWEAAQ